MHRLLLTALLLAACSDADAPTAPSDVAPAAGPLALSADGLGALGAATPFDSLAIVQALGEVSLEMNVVDGIPEAQVVWWVVRDGLLLAEVYGADGTVSRIDVTGDAPGPGGLVVGQSFADAGLARRDCAAGTDALAGSAVCAGPGSGSGAGSGLDLVFAHGWDGPASELPPTDVLGDAFLTRMIWRAD